MGSNPTLSVYFDWGSKMKKEILECILHQLKSTVEIWEEGDVPRRALCSFAVEDFAIVLEHIASLQKRLKAAHKKNRETRKQLKDAQKQQEEAEQRIL